jgi:hypothetical protein
MELPNIIKLIATAIVTTEDIEEAIEDWKGTVEDKYINLITPEIEND